MSLRLKIIAGFLVVCLIWGTTWAAVQIGVQSIPPLLSAALRFCIACAVLGVWIAVKGLPFPRSKNVWVLILMICATSLRYRLHLYIGDRHRFPRRCRAGFPRPCLGRDDEDRGAAGGCPYGRGR